MISVSDNTLLDLVLWDLVFKSWILRIWDPVLKIIGAIPRFYIDVLMDAEDVGYFKYKFLMFIKVKYLPTIFVLLIYNKMINKHSFRIGLM